MIGRNDGLGVSNSFLKTTGEGDRIETHKSLDSLLASFHFDPMN
jgi:hypothetical protein